MNRPLQLALRIWLPVAVALVVVTLFVYAAVQQSLRASADDPQIQLAQDGAAALDTGAAPRAVTGNGSVDIAHSLAPFVIVFNAKHQPLASSGLLNRQVPAPPTGVLDSAANGQNRVTWQPQADVRIASVVVPYKGGYVLAGRSLHEVEAREDNVLHLALLGCLVGLVASGFAAISAGIVSSRLSA